MACGVALLACSGGDDGNASLTPTASATTRPATAIPTVSVTIAPTVTPVPDLTATPSGETRPAVLAAIGALALWLGPVGDRPSIGVVSVEAVTWTNGCLDLTRVGQACTEALVEGFRVLLALGEATYEVRTDASGRVALWAPKVQILARFLDVSPNLVRFSPDDGGTIDAQLVPGSDFGVDLATLKEGDAVGVALADAPQNGGRLLVWLDPVGE